LLISTANFSYYIYTVLKKNIKPHFFTWFIWSLITGIAATAQYQGGAGFGFLVIASYSFFTGTIALLAIFRGEKHIARSDFISLGFCLVALFIWPLTKTPLYSVIIISIIEFVAIYPTLRKSYQRPNQENLYSFMIFGSTTLLSLLALSHYNIITLLYPLSIIVADYLIASLLIIRRKQLGYKVFA